MTEKTEVKFTDIIQMIADGNVPEGAVFISDDGCRAKMVSDVHSKPSLIWENGADSLFPNRVQLSAEIIDSTWYMEVPEKQLTLEEAIEEWRKGNKVKVVCGGESTYLNKYADFDDIWEDTDLEDLNDLLFRSEYYKVIY